MPSERRHLAIVRRPAFVGVMLVAAQSKPHGALAEFTVNHANADTSRWSCRLCIFEQATERTGTVSAGALQSTDGEMRFGRDTGIDRAGGYLDLNADYRVNRRAILTP